MLYFHECVISSDIDEFLHNLAIFMTRVRVRFSSGGHGLTSLASNHKGITFEFV